MTTDGVSINWEAGVLAQILDSRAAAPSLGTLRQMLERPVLVGTLSLWRLRVEALRALVAGRTWMSDQTTTTALVARLLALCGGMP